MGYLPFIWAQPIYLLNQQLRSSAKVLFGSHSPASKKDACLFFRKSRRLTAKTNHSLQLQNAFSGSYA